MFLLENQRIKEQLKSVEEKYFLASGDLKETSDKYENIKEEYMRMSEEVARMKEYIGLRKMEDEMLGD